MFLVECARISYDDVMPVLNVVVANLNNFYKNVLSKHYIRLTEMCDCLFSWHSQACTDP